MSQSNQNPLTCRISQWIIVLSVVVIVIEISWVLSIGYYGYTYRQKRERVVEILKNRSGISYDIAGVFYCPEVASHKELNRLLYDVEHLEADKLTTDWLDKRLAATGEHGRIYIERLQQQRSLFPYSYR